MNESVEKRRHQILNNQIWQVLFLVALPVVLTQVIAAIFDVFDTYFSSIVGTTEMSVTVFVSPVINTVNAVALGIGIAGTTLVAKHIGLRDYQSAKKTIGNMVSIEVIVVLSIVTIAYIFSKDILYSASLRGEALILADKYFKLTLFGTPFLFLNNVHMSLFRARGNTMRVLLINGASVFVKLAFNILFIVVLKQGILGIAYATILSRVFVSMFAVYDIFIKENVLRIGFKDLALTKTILFPLIIVGIPIVIEGSVQSFGHVIVGGFANRFGEEVLSAYGITNRLNSIAFSSVTGIGVAAVSLVSQNLAVGNLGRVKEILKKSLLAGLVVSLVLIGIAFWVSDAYAHLLSSGDDIVYQKTMTAISIYSISIIPFGIVQVMNGLYQGYRKTVYTMIIAFTRLWILRVLLIYVLITYTNLAEYAIWYGMLLSNILAAVFSLVIFFLDRDFRILLQFKQQKSQSQDLLS